MIYKRGAGKKAPWWYKFTFNGEVIRESTKQSNKRVAEQIEAAHKTSLAKGEVGIREKKRALSVREFAETSFLPGVRSTFTEKPNTLRYYESGVKSLLAFPKLANAHLDTITDETVNLYIEKRRRDGRQVTTINRELQALRRMFHLAKERGKVAEGKALPEVRMLPGERRRDRVLTPTEEAAYLANATPLLHDAAVILLDCGLRPEECHRLKWENIGESEIEIVTGKTANAARRLAVTDRVAEALKRQKAANDSAWVFPAPTKSGHIEPSTLKKPHAKACKLAEIGGDVMLYTFRHTCLTRWAPHMDAFTLAYLAGHSDMKTTRRYVHPQRETVRESMQAARAAVERARQAAAATQSQSIAR